jgi:uncharacterized protein (DUF1697 family)
VGVQRVISSRNILFETSSKNRGEMEEIIEKSLTHSLGIASTAIIYSKEYLKDIIKENPFKNIEDNPQYKLNITF